MEGALNWQGKKFLDVLSWLAFHLRLIPHPYKTLDEDELHVQYVLVTGVSFFTLVILLSILLTYVPKFGDLEKAFENQVTNVTLSNSDLSFRQSAEYLEAKEDLEGLLYLAMMFSLLSSFVFFWKLLPEQVRDPNIIFVRRRFIIFFTVIQAILIILCRLLRSFAFDISKPLSDAFRSPI